MQFQHPPLVCDNPFNVINLFSRSPRRSIELHFKYFFFCNNIKRNIILRKFKRIHVSSKFFLSRHFLENLGVELEACFQGKG